MPRPGGHMPQARVFRAALMIVAVPALAVFGRPSSAECPSSCISIGWNGAQICSTAPARDTAIATAHGWHDLAAGRLGGDCSANTHTNADVLTRDRYTLMGVASGIPYSFKARLEVTGRLVYSCSPIGHCARSGITALLREGTSNEISYSPDSFGPVDHALIVDVRCEGGSSFDLLENVRVEIVGSSFGTIAPWALGQIAFSDLPPGAYIVSCQGYHFSGPVPVLQSSWGRIKRIYR